MAPPATSPGRGRALQVLELGSELGEQASGVLFFFTSISLGANNNFTLFVPPLPCCVQKRICARSWLDGRKHCFNQLREVVSGGISRGLPAVVAPKCLDLLFWALGREEAAGCHWLSGPGGCGC